MRTVFRNMRLKSRARFAFTLSLAAEVERMVDLGVL